MSQDEQIKVEKRPPPEQREDSEESDSTLGDHLKSYRWYLAAFLGLLVVVLVLLLTGSVTVTELLLLSAAMLVLAVGAGIAWILHKVFLAAGSRY